MSDAFPAVLERCAPIVPRSSRSSDKHCPHWWLAIRSCCWCGTDDDAHAAERDAAYMREVRRQP
jgi:hypothetical protein